MASFDVVNYSLRPNKAIQRSMVFEGARMLQERLALSPFVYVGFGSVWFSDFIFAHRSLRVDEMVSLEGDDLGYARAVFNRPYKTVEVLKGLSADVLPELYARSALKPKPWMMWLDYDGDFSEVVANDVRLAIENLPPNSAFVVTFNSTPHKYGKPKERLSYLKSVFGSVVSSDLDADLVQGENIDALLAQFALDLMKSVAADSERESRFLPAFSVAYRDSAPMVTVGGFLPSKETESASRAIVCSPDWPSIVEGRVEAPHLTGREALALQSELPTDDRLDEESVKRLGFGLKPDQIQAFQKYYRFYPTFAQVIA